MRCGHGWEQSYEIEHHTDADAQQYVRYLADGRVLHSPLRRPRRQNCDAHVQRTLRAGQASSARDTVARRGAPLPGPVEVPQVPGAGEGAGAAAGTPHHWHLSDLLHPFQRKAG